MTQHACPFCGAKLNVAAVPPGKRFRCGACDVALDAGETRLTREEAQGYRGRQQVRRAGGSLILAMVLGGWINVVGYLDFPPIVDALFGALWLYGATCGIVLVYLPASVAMSHTRTPNLQRGTVLIGVALLLVTPMGIDALSYEWTKYLLLPVFVGLVGLLFVGDGVLRRPAPVPVAPVADKVQA